MIIESALEKVKEYFEVSNIPYNDTSLLYQIQTWFWNTDIADADILAACVIEYGSFDCCYHKSDMINALVKYENRG